MRKNTVVAALLLSILLAAIPKIASAQAAPQGPWVDEVVFFEEFDNAKAVDMLKANQMQTYYFPLRDPDLYSAIKADPNLWYAISRGNYNELSFNPAGPVFAGTGKLNPFAIPKIREAMNFIVDRDYIANEISAGLAIPRYTVLTPAFPDYATLIDTMRKIELEYSYDFEKAKAMITAEMEKLGAVMTGGKWNYGGEPVTLKMLIRTEDERREIGDYVSDQLESIGFTTDRMYKTSQEAGPIWMAGNPANGEWHTYTGGWVTTVISRDQAGNFDFFYTPRGRSDTLWQAYKPDPEFDYISDRLARNDFESIAERIELMTRALELSMKDSVRIWLQNRIAPWVARNDVQLTYDLAGGFYGCFMWPQTIRFKDQVGGQVKIGSGSDILTQPWNPPSGTNWIYDQMIIRATFDQSLMPDPFTGLFWPNLLKDAEVEVEKGLPVGKTLDWLSLKFVDKESITVPDDAWAGWNATTKQIIKSGAGKTSKVKVTLNFDENLFDRKYHDGTSVELADILFGFIFTFDQGDPASPIYDSAVVPALTAFKKDFKGFRITSADPLQIEFYTDVINLDAEVLVATAADTFDFEMSQGGAPWHLMAIGWLAEKDNLLAFSSKKSDTQDVPWTNYIAGESLPILQTKIEEANTAGFIPYAEVLGNNPWHNVTAEEARQKYTALQTWKNAHNHFWVGNGVFYLDSVDTLAPSVTLKAFRDHLDKADKWAGFTEPKLPEVVVSGPSTVIQTLASEFNVNITYKGQAYPTADLSFVKYLIVGPAGAVQSVGSATPVTDGKWKITLSSADTSVLPSGSNKVEVVATSRLASIPSDASASFITVAFGDYLGGELDKLKADTEAEIQGLSTDLEAQVNELQASLSTLNNYMIVAIVIAVIGVVMAIVFALVPRLRKK